jgi:hypothetical protein
MRFFYYYVKYSLKVYIRALTLETIYRHLMRFVSGLLG